MSKFLLLLGPSGVGKSSIIDELSKLDNRFVYISPFMTRPLRSREKSKIAISNEEMDEMWQQGKLLVINELYGGVRYGTPRAPIVEALSFENFPVLDWPIDRIEIMSKAFPDQLFIVYISPPSMDVLKKRLAKDERDVNGERFKNAEQELQRYWSSEYVGLYDMEIVSEDNKVSEISVEIYRAYLRAFEF